MYTVDTRQTFLYPEEPEMHDSLRAVDKYTLDELAYKYGVNLHFQWSATTITSTVSELLIRTLILQNEISEDVSAINFFNLFSCKLSVRKNEEAEKEGNINLLIKPGERLNNPLEFEKDFDEMKRSFSKANILPLDSVFENLSESEIKVYYDMAKFTKNEVHKKYGQIIPEDLISIVCAKTYIENIIFQLLNQIKKDPEMLETTINLMDIIEFHLQAIPSDEGDIYTITLRPGVNAKLLVKSDDMTENEE